MKILVKRIYPEMTEYKEWTEVSPFLAAGLVGVQIKYLPIVEDLLG